MNLHDTLSMKSASAPVVGEIYHVTGIATREVPDTINGGKRMSVVLSTDKGSIYAPSAVANAYLEMAASDPDGAAAELIARGFHRRTGNGRDGQRQFHRGRFRLHR